MMESLLPVFAIVIPIYWLWRRGVASNARIKVFKEVDSFLNPEQNNSEMTKEIVYNAYEDSKNNFIVLEMMYFTLFKVDSERFVESKEEFAKIPRAERKKMSEVVGKLMISNIKLSPITYLFIGFTIVALVLIVTLVNHLSPRKIKKNLKCWKEKTLYSLYSF